MMSLTDVFSVAVQHQEKETLAWMVLQSLYQARIISHANTGEARLEGIPRAEIGLPAVPCQPNFLFQIETSLMLLAT